MIASKLLVAAVALGGAGAALSHFRITQPAHGFFLSLLGGGLLGLAVLPVAGWEVWRRGGHIAWVAAGGLVWLGAAAQVYSLRGAARINDVTTSPDDPPSYAALQQAPPNVGRDMSYPPENAAIQRQAYPDLAPLTLELPPDQAVAKVRRALEALDLQVSPSPASPANPHQVEAQAESALFRFVDDVVVRVRPAPGGEGSVLDARSKSRDGKGDLGKNTERIRALWAELQR